MHGRSGSPRHGDAGAARRPSAPGGRLRRPGPCADPRPPRGAPPPPGRRLGAAPRQDGSPGRRRGCRAGTSDDTADARARSAAPTVPRPSPVGSEWQGQHRGVGARGTSARVTTGCDVSPSDAGRMSGDQAARTVRRGRDPHASCRAQNLKSVLTTFLVATGTARECPHPTQQTRLRCRSCHLWVSDPEVNRRNAPPAQTGRSRASPHVHQRRANRRQPAIGGRPCRQGLPTFCQHANRAMINDHGPDLHGRW